MGDAGGAFIRLTGMAPRVRRLAWAAWGLAALAVGAAAAGRTLRSPLLDGLAGALLLAALACATLRVAPWPRLPPLPGLFVRPGPRERWCAACGRPAPLRAACRGCGGEARPSGPGPPGA